MNTAPVIRLFIGAMPLNRDELRRHADNLPDAPGVYLFKDKSDHEIYVGKAQNLRKRVRQYFDARQSGLDAKTRVLVEQTRGIDYVETSSEVEALMLESRMIKDIQPKFNVRLRSNVNYPFVEITWGEDFPRVLVTRDRTRKRSKYYGPFAHADQLRVALRHLQRIFKFRSCNQPIEAEDPRRRHARPCLNYYIGRSSAPCAARIEKGAYRANLRRLSLVISGRTGELRMQLARKMEEASREKRFEEAATLRDQIQALESLGQRGDLRDGIEPNVPQVDLHAGPRELQRVLGLPDEPLTIEGIDISHFQGGQTVASVVRFEGGFPSREGYRRFKIKTAAGGDDCAAIREVVRRRYGRLLREKRPLPQMILIDGGVGQLRAAETVLIELGLHANTDSALPAATASEQRPVRRAAEAEAPYGPRTKPESDSDSEITARGAATSPFLASLSKQHELLHTPAVPAGIRIPRRSVALRMLQYIRDEAHRFAQHYHHILQRKRVLGERKTNKSNNL